MRRGVGAFRPRARMAAGLLALLALAAPLPARAAGAEDALPADFGLYRQSGPLAWKGTLALRNAGYDSNIFSVDAERVSDYSATFSPRLDLLLRPGPRSVITAAQEIDRTAHLHTSSQNTSGSLTSLRGDLFLAHTRLHGAASYDSARVRPVDRLDLRPRQIDLHVESGATFERSERVRIALTGVIDDFSFREDRDDTGVSFRDTLERREVGGTLDFSYRSFRKTWLTATAERVRADFDQLENPRNSDRTQLMAGVRIDPSATVSGRLLAGVLRLSPERRTDPRFDGGVFDASLNVRFGDSFTLGATANRDLQFTIFADNSWLVRHTVAVSGVWHMAPRLGLEFGTERASSRYPEQTLVSRHDRDRTVYAGLLRPIGERMQATLRYTNFERGSTLDEFDLEISRFTGSFSYVF